MGSTRKFRVITRFVEIFFQGCGPEKGLVWIVPSFHKQRMNEYMKRTLPCQHMLGLEMLWLSSFIHSVLPYLYSTFSPKVSINDSKWWQGVGFFCTLVYLLTATPAPPSSVPKEKNFQWSLVAALERKILGEILWLAISGATSKTSQ